MSSLELLLFLGQIAVLALLLFCAVIRSCALFSDFGGILQLYMNYMHGAKSNHVFKCKIL